MSAKIIDGKALSQRILGEAKDDVAKIVAEGGRPPCLAVILVGGDPASRIYVDSKKAACVGAGIISVAHELPDDASEAELLRIIADLNADGSVDGILVQSPLPARMDEQKALLAIDPAKDVDGFHPMNAGLLAKGGQGLLPGTPAGIIELLKYAGVKIEGAEAVVVGRSNIVGKPAAMLLIKENATVTICHSRTQNLSEITKRADILVAALGKRNFITPNMIKEGAAVIDVGIHRTPGSRKITGDVDPACADVAGYITPVPGGVGPMTVAMLIKNCVKAYNQRTGNGR
ncbi:MAG: bifunctional methylenetetrahydrofolate dehydrogenase/methenyltetrahydrofolate cyclohydrolase FolD [Clostridiales bacterium]|jgi:methylenetetrahydrofolate dehydrogenase (NADP+)/methenyltetrahydrofolate cyclohydrolase|nr:bifunctional methylenetetrahydrofolate dehydrogenase/methenyltetrahydrofolate cyclohydrolase FolD [Clostridiales bacterium]